MPHKSPGQTKILRVVLVLFAEKCQKSWTLKKASANVVAGFGEGRRNWRVLSSNAEVLGRTNFIKSSWTGTDKSQQVDLKGVIYVGTSGDQLIVLSAQDVAPSTSEEMRQAEAAVKTFKLER